MSAELIFFVNGLVFMVDSSWLRVHRVNQFCDHFTKYFIFIIVFLKYILVNITPGFSYK